MVVVPFVRCSGKHHLQWTRTIPACVPQQAFRCQAVVRMFEGCSHAPGRGAPGCSLWRRLASPSRLPRRCCHAEPVAVVEVLARRVSISYPELFTRRCARFWSSPLRGLSMEFAMSFLGIGERVVDDQLAPAACRPERGPVAEDDQVHCLTFPVAVRW